MTSTRSKDKVKIELLFLVFLAATVLLTHSTAVNSSDGSQVLGSHSGVHFASTSSNNNEVPNHFPVNIYSHIGGGDPSGGCSYAIRAAQMISSCGGHPIPLPPRSSK